MNSRTLKIMDMVAPTKHSDLNKQNITLNKFENPKELTVTADKILQPENTSDFDTNYIPSTSKRIILSPSSSSAGPVEMNAIDGNLEIQEETDTTVSVLQCIEMDTNILVNNNRCEKEDRTLVTNTNAIEENNNLINDQVMWNEINSDDSIADPNYEADYSNEVDQTSDDQDMADEPTEKGRKRKRTPSKWRRNLKKFHVTAGQEHISQNNNVISAKSLLPPCKESCRNQCRKHIKQEERRTIHKTFWSPNKSIDHKRQFVASHVKTYPISRARPVNGKREGKRGLTRQYSFEINGVPTTVCKVFFLNTLSISQTFVTTALRKKQSGGIIQDDRRGKHTNHRKVAEFVKQLVRDHINKFPLVPSHYSRERSNRKYLGAHLNLSRMYNFYKTECEEKNLPEDHIAKEWIYSEIFNTEYNISFKIPDNDTCDTCDFHLVSLRQVQNDEEKNKIASEYEQHLAEASKRYALKKQDKEKASLNKNSHKVLCVDLQKCLPTPVLTNAQSFYSLKLWTYNYTIYDDTIKKTICIMWDESKAGRGANEMASGLMKWALLNNGNKDLQEITIWSDNCPSQNRNIVMVMCYFWMFKLIPSLKTINHKFLLRGHTHLEVDASHSLIEREKKKTPSFQIMSPWDWQQLARMSSASNPFEVINMESQDFKNVKMLYENASSPFVHRKKSQDQEFSISKVVHFQVRSETKGVLYYKTDFDAPEFLKIDLNRSGRRVIFPEELNPVRDGAKPISAKKYKHLQGLLKWVPQVFHDFYKNLSVDDSLTDE